jgi:hypothetical protein
MQPWRLTRPKVGRSPDAERLAAEREPDEPASDRRRRPRRRSARPPARVPGAPRHAAEPTVAIRERAQGQLRDKYRPGLFEPAGNSCFLVDLPILERCGAPGRRVAGVGDQVLRPPRNAVERAAIETGGQLGIGTGRLLQSQFLGKRDHALQKRVELLEPAEVQFRQLGRADLPRTDQRGQLRDRQKGQCLVALRPPGSVRLGGARLVAPDANSRPQTRIGNERDGGGDVVADLDLPQ